MLDQLWDDCDADTTDKRHKKRPRHEMPVAAVDLSNPSKIVHTMRGLQQAYLTPGNSPLWLSVAPRYFASLLHN